MLAHPRAFAVDPPKDSLVCIRSSMLTVASC
jgi:hypothetical protein